MFKNGERVITPYGAGKIERVYSSGCKVNLEGARKMIPMKDIKPHKSPHQRLIDYGFNFIINDGLMAVYEYDKSNESGKVFLTFLIEIGHYKWHLQDWFTIKEELHGIITDFLKEMRNL